MNFLKKYTRKKVRGAELVLTGGALIFTKFLLPWAAPLALGVYGLYRWLVKKSYGDGIVIIASGMLLWVLLEFTPLGWILWLPLIAGIAILVYGAILMLFSGDSDEEIEP